ILVLLAVFVLNRSVSHRRVGRGLVRGYDIDVLGQPSWQLWTRLNIELGGPIEVPVQHRAHAGLRCGTRRRHNESPTDFPAAQPLHVRQVNHSRGAHSTRSAALARLLAACEEWTQLFAGYACRAGSTGRVATRLEQSADERPSL